jgi:uncharacterized membrane protein YphA (DoxX/SURF4 family)
MTIISHISRIIIGLLFVFSGYVKAVDPLGFTYKLGEYFESMHLEFLAPFALALAILVIAAELAMGLCLLARVRMQLVAWGVLLFMLFFLVLTFYIAVKGNVVKDCGCFGDALILSNTATFLKNLFLMPFVVIIFLWRKKYTPVAKCMGEWLIAIAFFAFAAGIQLYCLHNLPVIDFMPYKVGTNIPKAMEYPENAKPAKYKTRYYYLKNGETKEFDETNYPWNDSTWTYVDVQSELVEKGYEPPIHDLDISNMDGENITDDIINSENFTFIFTAREIENIDISHIDKVNEIADYCLITDGFDFYAYMAASNNEIDEFIAKTNAKYPFCIGDGTTIKTMIRSNPGLMLIKDGNILAKWSYKNIPSIEQITRLAATDYETIVSNAKAAERNTTLLFALIALILACFLNIIKYVKVKFLRK